MAYLVPTSAVIMTNNLHFLGRLLFPTLTSFALACSAGGGSPTGVSGGTGAGTSTGSGGVSTGTGGTTGTGGGITLGGSTGTRDPNDMRDLPVREKMCDANGMNCTCLRLALLGTLESAANQKDTKPFVDWLNGNSDGTATVTMVSTKPTIDAAFLANYDILLVANVNTWTFTADEKAAVETWVRTTGGGIITMTGFVSTDGEPAATSQLIEFAGFKYQPPKTSENGQSVPVYYNGGTTDLKNCLAWSGNSEAIITSPIKFSPQTGSLEKLTFELDYVGAFIGWAVAPPTTATVVATDPVTSSPMAAALELDGTGRIFAFGDEWVIFANQWEPAGNPNNMQMDMYNPCWVASDGTTQGFFHSVKTLYQTKQFWYNAINWVAPPNECNFVVEDPDVVIVK
jgi:hypothetical protein